MVRRIDISTLGRVISGVSSAKKSIAIAAYNLCTHLIVYFPFGQQKSRIHSEENMSNDCLSHVLIVMKYNIICGFVDYEVESDHQLLFLECRSFDV